jgi:hypothetical protein
MKILRAMKRRGRDGWRSTGSERGGDGERDLDSKEDR